MSRRIIAIAVIAIAYAYIEYWLNVETNYNIFKIPYYRVAYLLILFVPAFIINRNMLKGLRDGILSIVIEDLSYWSFARTLPASWAWYYPVFHHMPLDDVLGIAAVIVLFALINKKA